MARTNEYAALHQRLYEATTVEMALDALSQAGLLQDSRIVAQSKDAYDAVATAFYRLQLLAHDDTDAIRRLVLALLLPFLDGDTPDEADLARSRCREILVDMLDGLPSRERDPLRAAVLDHIGQELERSARPDAQASPDSPCWTVASIGLRRPDIAKALWHVIDVRDDEHGDIALATLTSLGLEPSERQRAIAVAHERAQQRRTRGLIQTLQHLADPSSIDVIAKSWLTGNSSSQDQEHWLEDSLSWRTLTTIADIADGLSEAPANATKVARMVWRTITNKRGRAPRLFEILLGSDLAPRCSSPDVVSSLLKLLPQIHLQGDDDDNRLHQHYLAYLRLSECIRPAHLRRWEQPSEHDALQAFDIITQDALRNTQYAGRFATSGGHAKEAAWQIAFMLATPDALEWFDHGIAHETNPYLRGELMKSLASFRLDPSPVQVLTWVRDPFDVRGDQSGEFAVHEGAIALAESSATRAAFD
ncbi:MAG: hypothetical protein ACRDID_21665, partial [Ktedonobacterales bacterium]